MTSPVSLTQAEAAQKISQIESARDQAVSKLKQIQGAQEEMLSGSWHGGSAGKYNTTSQAQADDMNQIITQLNSIVQTGSEHIRSVANMDNN
jgi:flagellar biosynthesis chaperone FliJ